MFVVSLQFSALSTRSFTVDRPVVFVGAAAINVGTFVVSTDPSVTTAKFSAPSSATTLTNVWTVGTSSNPIQFKLNVDMQQGETVFVATAGAGTVCLYFDESGATS